MIRSPYASRKKRPYVMVIFIALCLVSCAYIATVLLWPLRAITPTNIDYQKTVPASVTAAWPTSYSALGTTEQGVLVSSNDTQVPIASITKIITSLVILDTKPLKQGEVGPTITLTQADVARYNQYIALDGTVAPATAGMQLTEYQLLQGMLMGSANNYADTAAVWAYGSQDAYLAAAKLYLQKHGLEKTVAVDATGFSPNSKSTPEELVKLGILAMKDPIIVGIVGQKTAVLPGVGTFTNTNRLLGTNGIVGLKTGTTEEAGSCLLFASQFTKDGTPVTLVGVVLGAPNHPNLFQSVAGLTEQTTNQFTDQTIVGASAKFATYVTPWGATSSAISPAVTELTWKGSPATITATTSALKPGSHTKTGTVAVTIGNKTTTKALTLEKPLEKPSWFWRIMHPRYIFNM